VTIWWGFAQMVICSIAHGGEFEQNSKGSSLVSGGILSDCCFFHQVSHFLHPNYPKHPWVYVKFRKMP
jgi:hypothetical protein